MTSARDWLPLEALRDGALSALLTAHAERWAETWFGSDRVALVRLEDAARPGAASTTVWESLPQGAMLIVDDHMELAMARWMVGATGAANKLNARDDALLGKLSGMAVSEFISCLADEFGVGPSARRRTGAGEQNAALCFSVTIGTARVFDLLIDEEAAVRARRALIRTSASEPALGPRADAFGPAGARIGVKIGAARVPLSEIASLAAGDVLVLDHGQRDALALTINGRATPAGGHLHQEDGALCLTITQLNGEDRHDHDD